MKLGAGDIIEIKPLGGAAGDMFVGACAALWPEGRAACLSDLAAAGLPAETRPGFAEVRVNGFAAVKFEVAAAGPAAPTGAYPAIAARLGESALRPAVREIALAILRRLAEAEAAVHGKPVEEVHFHELADWDSVADIVGAASFIAGAGAARWRVGPLPLGGGFAETQHGRVTVPAPAVLRLLEGFAFRDDGVAGERVTPTGAAILAHLAAPGGAAPTEGRLAGAGMGAGDRRFPGLANVLQLVRFAGAGTAPGDEIVAEIACDIDDMTPEELAVAADRLRALPGVLDLAQTPQIGKKGRAMILLRILCDRAAADEVGAAVFAETSTLGLRLGETRRRTLPRRAAGAAKLAARPGGAETAKAESDALAGLPTLAARRARAREIEAAALAAGGEGDEG